MNVRSGQVLVINGVSADFGKQTLRDKSGNSFALRPQAFAVLQHLTENANRLVTKDELMRAVWRGVAVTDDSLVQCIHEIRRALGDSGQVVLKTLPRRGYCLELPATEATEIAVPRGSPKVIRMTVALGATLILVAAALAWWLVGHGERTELSSGEPPVVALTLFTDITGDPVSRGLAFGIKRDLHADLLRFQEFQVVRRNPRYSYEKSSADTLGPTFVLGGSIEHEGNRLRITAQLQDATTGTVLWSQRWDRSERGVFTLQTEIYEEVSRRLGGSGGLIQEAGRAVARRKSPGDLTAYELHLLGTERLELVSRADVQEAIRLLEQSVEREPRLARAWVELYRAHEMAAEFGMDPASHRRVAAYAAERAVRLNPSDAKARVVLGMSLWQNDFKRSKFEFDTALILAPHARDVLTLYAGWASRMGQAERGAAIADQLVRRYPDLPLWSAREFSHAYFMAGRYADALAMASRLAPENHTLLTWAVHAGALASAGRIEEARNWVTRAVAARPDMSIEAIAGTGGLGDAERQRLVDAMRLAGFAPCAKPGTLEAVEKALLLRECQGQP
jgi:TolB-like protein/DNA-binding winged helix-turn-helix (wHTH) protein